MGLCIEDRQVKLFLRRLMVTAFRRSSCCIRATTTRLLRYLRKRKFSVGNKEPRGMMEREKNETQWRPWDLCQENIWAIVNVYCARRRFFRALPVVRQKRYPWYRPENKPEQTQQNNIMFTANKGNPFIKPSYLYL